MKERDNHDSACQKARIVIGIGRHQKGYYLFNYLGAAVLLSLLDVRPFPFDMAWIAIILCGIPIILEAIIGLVTSSI